MRTEQFIATSPKAGVRIWSADPVQIADPAPPVDEIEQRLCVSVCQRGPGPPVSACSSHAAGGSPAPGARRLPSRRGSQARRAGEAGCAGGGGGAAPPPRRQPPPPHPPPPPP